MKIEQQNRFAVINHTANSLYSLNAYDKYRATSLGRDIWKSPLVGENASLEKYCNMEGFNAMCYDSIKARIGIVSNDNDFCRYCDAVIGFGTSAGPSCGNYGGYWSDNGPTSIQVMGYILIQ